MYCTGLVVGAWTVYLQIDSLLHPVSHLQLIQI